jgi:hypothetical protein
MRTNTRLAFVVSVVCFLAACGSERQPVVSTGSSLPSTRGMVDVATKIMQKSSDPMAGEVLAVLQDIRIMSLQQAVTPHSSVILCEVDPSDTSDYSRRASELLHTEARAFYDPEQKGIFVQKMDPKNPISDGYFAFTLLHEVRHAVQDRHGGFSQDALSATSEIEAHEFEFRAIEEVGGAAYRELLDEATGRVSDEMSSEDLGRNLAQFTDEYPPELDDIFGPSLSRHETMIRLGDLWLNATFTAIEQRFYPDMEKVQERKVEAYLTLRMMIRRAYAMPEPGYDEEQ